MKDARITAPDLSDLTEGWWWLKVQHADDSAGWMQARVFRPDVGPYVVTVGSDGYSRTQRLVEGEAGLTVGIAQAPILILAASRTLHPDGEANLRRQLANAKRTAAAQGTVLGAVMAATLGLDFPDAPDHPEHGE